MNKIAKVIFLGESGVGKTCILKRIIENKYDNDTSNTLGIDIKTKYYYNEFSKNKIKFNFIDTAGQERFLTFTKNYLNGSNIILFVFDDEKSFLKIEEKYIPLCENSLDLSKCILILIQSKNDLLKNIDGNNLYNEGRKLSQKLNAFFISVSSLDGNNINALYDYICKESEKNMNLFKNPKPKINLINPNEMNNISSIFKILCPFF